MGISSIGCSSIMQQMKQQMETSFKSSDADGDGKLSKSEFAAFDTAMRANAPEGMTPPSGVEAPSSDDIFSLLDSDGDGSVSLEEAQAGPSRSSAQQAQQMSSDTMSAILQFMEGDDSSGNSLSSLLSGDSSSDGGFDISSIIQQILAQYGEYADDATSTLNATA